MTLRIESAIARAHEQGISINKKELAALLWPELDEASRIVNMRNISSGRTKRVKPEWIGIICRATGVTADFLCGVNL